MRRQAGDAVDPTLVWGPWSKRQQSVLVYDHDSESVSLDQWLLQHQTPLTMARRLSLIGDLAEIVAYAHSRRLAHQAVNS